MTPAEARAIVAGVISAAVSDELNVYAAPPDVVATPAVVIRPRGPYREPSTVCHEELSVSLVILLPRAAGAAGLDVLDAVVDLIVPALRRCDDPGVAYERVTDIGVTQEVAGAELLSATIDIRLYI
jgi:hypothetical protein